VVLVIIATLCRTAWLGTIVAWNHLFDWLNYRFAPLRLELISRDGLESKLRQEASSTPPGRKGLPRGRGGNQRHQEKKIRTVPIFLPLLFPGSATWRR
jgi:hypothetical protein